MPYLTLNFSWAGGTVRVRAKAKDPLEGLRGREYIAARNLSQPVQRRDPFAADRAEAAMRLLTRPATPTRAPQRRTSAVLPFVMKRRPA